MRNIHIVPTDKPSKLWIDNDVKKLVYGVLSIDNIYNCKNQNIYITNDEEIKAGDWFVHSSHGITNIYKAKSVVPVSIITTCDNGCWVQYCKKIILTTDQDLIKDGIQSITDEFLEWFIENPSCESVKVRKEKYSERFDNDKSAIGNPDTWGNRWVIIIPKQETDEKGNPITYWGGKDRFFNFEELDEKQETIEEVAERLLFDNTGMLVENHPSIKQSMMDLAKWQQQRNRNLYSEEETSELVYNIIGEYAKHYNIIIDGEKLNNLFEQFKKKQ